MYISRNRLSISSLSFSFCIEQINWWDEQINALQKRKVRKEEKKLHLVGQYLLNTLKLRTALHINWAIQQTSCTHQSWWGKDEAEHDPQAADCERCAQPPWHGCNRRRPRGSSAATSEPCSLCGEQRPAAGCHSCTPSPSPSTTPTTSASMFCCFSRHSFYSMLWMNAIVMAFTSSGNIQIQVYHQIVLYYLLYIINRIQRCNSRFLTISSLRRKLSPTRTLKWPGRNRVQITCNTSSAYHVQHVVLCATWYERTAQLLSLTELKSHLFELYFTGRTI